MKLRHISELSVSIVLQNNLGHKLKGNKKLKNFVKGINWNNFEMQNAMQDIKQIGDLKK